MEVSKDNSSIALGEFESWKSTECFQRFLESQKELFHSQIDQLQNIVVTQCKLTGVNPLSQEMAAGALSINIGKRPRDLLNPKAIKYMQSIFSVKDAVSKKESREISALCSVTVTQVREFFASQRARVRKLVRLSREKAIKSDACKISQDGCFPVSDASIPVINPAPLNSMDPKTAEEAPSCSSQVAAIPGIDDSDKTFVDNIFSLMRKEVTFSGQVKHIEWILQIQNSSVLNWFLNQGGLMILTAWLGEAALEEQTTVLLSIFKVLCHLPLHKALPVQMSAILQTVNRLRFYRTSDISNRAKVLLSRWSKIFVRNQALKKPALTNSTKDAQKERIFKLSTGEIPGNEWQANADFPEIFHLAFESSENIRNSESSSATKLLTSSTDDSNKKQNRGVSPAQTRERRKVLPMEQPGRNNISRNIQATRALPSNQGRPMSADDIQKAKMRAMFMQSKYGKNGSSNENQQQKIENLNKSCTSQTLHQLSASKVLLEHKIEETTHPKLLAIEPSILPETPKVLASETSTLSEMPTGSKPSSGPKGPSLEELKMKQIPWHMPPEVKINSLWKIGVGEKSKEVEVQIGRTKREKEETIYQRLQDIPSNPKEPWDLEMDHDDTLTPEIPTEQPPEPDVAEPSLPSPHHIIKTPTETHVASQPPPPITKTNEAAPEPDLELLAVLLKHPELVFALTSGQGSSSSSLTNADTVRLLDMIKSSQTDLTTVLNGLKGEAKTVELEPEPEPVSLPSPTPPSERIMNEWRAEVVSRPVPILPTTLPIQPSQDRLFANARAVQPQTQIPNFSLAQLRTTVTPLTQQLPISLNARSFPVASLPERHLPVMNSISNQAPTNPSQQRVQTLQPESTNYGQMQTLKPSPPVVRTPQKDRFLSITSPPLQTVLPGHHGMMMMLQPHRQPEPQPQPVQPTMQWNSLSTNSSSSSFRHNSFAGSASSSHWSQSNQNNYNIFPTAAAPAQLSQRERNDFLVEPEFETWSPARSPERSRSPEYRSGQDYSESRRDSSRSSRTDWSRRRDSGRRDHRHVSSRRWRDRRH